MPILVAPVVASGHPWLRAEALSSRPPGAMMRGAAMLLLLAAAAASIIAAGVTRDARANPGLSSGSSPSSGSGSGSSSGSSSIPGSTFTSTSSPTPGPAAGTEQAGTVPPALLDPAAYLLNALLVPALDPDLDSPTWVDPRPVMACGEMTTILVNGHPLVSGEPVPPGLVDLDWVSHGCHPFGLGGPSFDGEVGLEVERIPTEADAWRARVDSRGLVVTFADGRIVPIDDGDVRMPREPAPTGRPVARAPVVSGSAGR